MNKHLIWALTIFSIVLMLCGTLIWINNNAWTLRFEMDENTKEAIESVEYPIVDEKGEKVCYSEICYLDLEENQISGCSMGKVDCKLWENKYGFAYEVNDDE